MFQGYEISLPQRRIEACRRAAPPNLGTAVDVFFSMQHVSPLQQEPLQLIFFLGGFDKIPRS